MAFGAVVETSTLVDLERLVMPLKEGWSLAGDADSQALLSLTFAVKLRNVDKVQQLFEQVSDPKHAKYGAYESREWLNELTKPSDASIKAVQQFIDVRS